MAAWAVHAHLRLLTTTSSMPSLSPCCFSKATNRLYKDAAWFLGMWSSAYLSVRGRVVQQGQHRAARSLLYTRGEKGCTREKSAAEGRHGALVGIRCSRGATEQQGKAMQQGITKH